MRPYFAGRRAASITTADFRRFISARQDAGASNGEINRELAGIKRAYSLAVQGNKLAYRPYIPMLREANARAGFFERETFLALLDHLPEPVRPMIRFAFVTGWRIRSEVQPLKWSQVDFEAGTIRLEAGTTKTATRVRFPSPKNCVASWPPRARKPIAC